MSADKFRSSEVDQLFDAFLTLKSREDWYALFEDLCTIGEIRSIAQRFAVASMLDSRETYHEIAERTGASTATISRVNRCLLYGADGYRRVLDRLPTNDGKQPEEP